MTYSAFDVGFQAPRYIAHFN